MTIQETIASLDALRAKATQGEWYTDQLGEKGQTFIGGNGYMIAAMAGAFKDSGTLSNAAYIIALHNAFPALRQAILDGERYKAAGEALAKAVEEMDISDYSKQRLSLEKQGVARPMIAATESGFMHHKNLTSTKITSALTSYRAAIEDSSK